MPASGRVPHAHNSVRTELLQKLLERTRSGTSCGTSSRPSTSLGCRLSTAIEGKVPMNSGLRKASWVLLTTIGVLTLFISLVSAFLAYFGHYPIGGLPV